MRRLFGCAAALVGAATVGVYAGADHVYNNPDSALVQNAGTAYQIATDRSVLQHATKDVAERFGEMFLGKKKTQPPCPEHAQEAPAEPKPIGADVNQEPEDVVPPWVKNVEPLPAEQRLGKGEEECEVVPPLDPAKDDGHHEPPGCPQQPRDLNVPCPGTKPPAHADGHEPGADKDSSQKPTFMPPITDNETPAAKPHASADAERIGDFLGSFLFDFFHDPASDRTDGTEESATFHPGQPPNCQVDPDYFQQYPGCPFMGRCPSGSPLPPNGRPIPKLDTPKKGAVEEQIVPNSEPNPKPMTLQKKCGTEDCPAHPEVDTTEFRPSDAKKGEFDRIPF
jgi:hypothetical protein